MSSTSGKGLVYASIGIAVAAIAISVAAAWFAQQQFVTPPTDVPAPQTREFYLFTQVDEAVEEREEELAIPPDLFSQTQITVNKGDKVVIHFYNLEPAESQEHHTFTMSAPYAMNYDLNAEEQKTIEFTATEAGAFEYFCSYHQPTMRGQLVVLV